MALSNSTTTRNPSGAETWKTFEAGGEKIHPQALVDADGAHAGIVGNPVKTSPDAPNGHYATDGASAEKNKLVNSGACTLKHVKVQIAPTILTAQWAFVYDGIDATGTLVDRILIPPAGQGSESYDDLVMSTGIFVAISTDYSTLTPPGSDEAVWAVRYNT